MRWIAWNIRHGGGASRTPEIGLALRALAPDVVVLTEFRAARGSMLRTTFADAGLAWQETAPSSPGGNSVLIASRFAMQATQRPGGVPASRWMSVRLTEFDLDVAGVHVPDDTRPAEKARYWQELVGWARERRDRRAAILGDVNTARRGPDGQNRFRCEALLGTLLSLGYVDAWRRMNPGDREDTWVGARGEAARLDAVYLSAPLGDALQAARHAHAPASSGLSDHAAVVVDVALDSSGGSRAPTRGLFATEG